jgi:spermidine/putrescine transport system substrate-binding protein
MRKAIVWMPLLALLAGCRPGVKTLQVYTWADYIRPDLISRFEKENGCRIVIDTFDSNEAMYAKLKAGASGYDIVTPSSYMVKIMHDQGMLLRLDRSRLPNLANVDTAYLKIAVDRTMDHSVPYMMTYAGIGYLKDKVADMRPTWKMLDRRDLHGRMTVLNDMRETLGAALKSLGHSLNTVDEGQLAEARDVVVGWKRNIAKFDNEQYKIGLASGEFFLVHGYSGDILKVREENKNVSFMIPREGFSLSCDDLVILKTSGRADLAYAFINFLHRPDVAAANTEFIMYLCPNLPSYALLSDSIKTDPGIFPSPEVLARGEIIVDLGADNAKYVKVWDQIKAAGD